MKEELVVIRYLPLQVIKTQDELLVEQLKEVIHFLEREHIIGVVKVVFRRQELLDSLRVLNEEHCYQELKFLDRIVDFSIQQEDLKVELTQIQSLAPILKYIEASILPDIPNVALYVAVIVLSHQIFDLINLCILPFEFLMSHNLLLLLDLLLL